MIEGPDLVEAALSASAHFEALYVDVVQAESGRVGELTRRAHDLGVRVFALAPEVFARVSDAVTPQGAMASIRLPLADLGQIDGRGLIVVAHGLQDPGNAGTIIRSAAAAGADGVVFTGHSVDPVNPKCLRASAGAIFAIPVVVSELTSVMEYLAAQGRATWAAVLGAPTELREVDLSGPCAVLIGSEANGLDDAALSACQGSLRIDMAPGVESLNAGVAASLVAFAARWQRQDAERVTRGRSLGGS